MTPRLPFKHVAFVVALLFAAACLYGWSIIARGFSARDEPSYLEAFLARRLQRLAIPSDARDVRNPVEASPQVLSAAMAHYVRKWRPF